MVGSFPTELAPEGDGTRFKVTRSGLETFPQNNPDFSRELEDVLAALARVYATCATYEDRGTASANMPDELGQQHTSEDTFTTAFDRDGKRFRFELKSGNRPD